MDIFRPIISRILAAPVAALAAWLFLKWKIDIDTATQSQMVETLVAWIIPIFAAVWAVLHKIIDKYVNPADAATTALAAESKVDESRAKAARRIR